MPDEEIGGLEEKLRAGNYENLLDFAQKTKELFTKKLASYQFSETAQEIHAYLLAEVYTRFNFHVFPQMKKDLQQEKIHHLTRRANYVSFFSWSVWLQVW